MIVIPMAGLSSRFFKAGFNVPKYQLDLPNGQTVFEWAVTSFQKYFSEEHFLFILRDVYDTYNFVKKSIERLGINSFEIIVLNEETKGQADTVYLGLNQSKYMQEHPNEALFIFNIDSRRHEFIKPNFIEIESVNDTNQDTFEFSFEKFHAFKSDVIIFIKILSVETKNVILNIPKSQDKGYQQHLNWIMQNLDKMAKEQLIYFPTINNEFEDRLEIKITKTDNFIFKMKKMANC